MLNIITKTPWDESGLGLDVRGGQNDLMDVNMRTAGTINEDFGWKVTGQYMSASDFKPKHGEPDEGTIASAHYYGTNFHESEIVKNYKIKSLRGEGTLYYRFGEDWELEGTYGFSLNDNFTPLGFMRMRERGYLLQHQNLKLSNDHWQLRVNRTASDEGDSYLLGGAAFQADAMYNQLLENGASEAEAREQVFSQLPALRDSSGYQLNGRLWSSGLQYNNTFSVGSGSLDLITGLQLRRNLPSSEETFLADAIGRDISSTVGGAFLQLDYNPTDALRINAAGRVDNHSAYGTRVSPKASVMYDLTSNHTLRATYNRAFKSPTTLARHTHIGFVRGNTDGFTLRSGPTTDADVVRRIDPLQPEEVNSVELGYKGTIQNRLFVDVVAYNSWYQDFVSPQQFVASPDPSFLPGVSQPTFAFDDGELVGDSGFLYTYFNYGKARVQGVDLGLEYALPQTLSVSGSVSYITIADADRGDATQEILLNVPNLKLKGEVTVRNVGLDNLFVSMSGRWKQSYKFRASYWNSADFYDDGKIPARFTANLTAGYSFPETGLQLKASATNLFNTTVPDKLGSPEMGRLIQISATYKLDGLNF